MPATLTAHLRGHEAAGGAVRLRSTSLAGHGGPPDSHRLGAGVGPRRPGQQVPQRREGLLPGPFRTHPVPSFPAHLTGEPGVAQEPGSDGPPSPPPSGRRRHVPSRRRARRPGRRPSRPPRPGARTRRPPGRRCPGPRPPGRACVYGRASRTRRLRRRTVGARRGGGHRRGRPSPVPLGRSQLTERGRVRAVADQEQYGVGDRPAHPPQRPDQGVPRPLRGTSLAAQRITGRRPRPYLALIGPPSRAGRKTVVSTPGDQAERFGSRARGPPRWGPWCSRSARSACPPPRADAAAAGPGRRGCGPTTPRGRGWWRTAVRTPAVRRSRPAISPRAQPRRTTPVAAVPAGHGRGVCGGAGRGQEGAGTVADHRVREGAARFRRGRRCLRWCGCCRCRGEHDHLVGRKRSASSRTKVSVHPAWAGSRW